MKPEPIAVVGIGGVFPDALTLDRFWANIAAKRCAAREVPAGRWILPKEKAFDPAKGAPDKVYSLKACFVEGFEFDPRGLALPAELLEKLDPVFHLALHAARQAFDDGRVERLERARTGVVIGNIALPTDSSAALTRELLLPQFEEKALGKRLSAQGNAIHPYNRFVAGLPGGAIARALGLGGGAYTLDAACASGLYAVKLACDELRAGRADAMLTGGVSRPESLYTQMGFSQLRALSASGKPSPFDAAADGLVVGEGAGMFVLKRLSDALKDGDKIYGLIAGAGLSNDVGGSLLAPNTPGQLRAMRAAYQEAEWSPSQVDLIECHATGTPTGDPVEVASLKALWGERGWSQGQCALGSVKSNVGHLLTGAGAAGLMKILLAMKNETLPPTANFTRAAPGLDLDGSPFRVQNELSSWERRADGAPRRAAASAFGFGGINAHLLIEEFVPGSKATARGSAPSRATSGSVVSVGIVGMEARFGELSDLREFQEAALAGKEAGRKLKEVGVSADNYRIPPKEVEEMLPQQLLMLDAARAALADAGQKDEGRDRMGVFLGIALDDATNYYHTRWILANKVDEWASAMGWALAPAEKESLLAEMRRSCGPALTANKVMGSLGGIVASRVAREFHIGGPSFTVSSEGTSSLKALELGVRALQRGELDSALVGGVDIGADGGQGAAAFVLKRLDDAVKAGDRIYAVVKGLGTAAGGGLDEPASSAACAEALRRALAEAGADVSTVEHVELSGTAAEGAALCEVFGTAKAQRPCALGSVKAVVGETGAASGAAGLARAALALYQEILPASGVIPGPELTQASKRFHLPKKPQYWLRNRAEGPRRAGVSALSVDGTAIHCLLEGFERTEESALEKAERRQPLGARNEALFAVEADDFAGLLKNLDSLRSWVSRQDAQANIERLARAWYSRNGLDPSRPKAVALVARDWKELLALIQQAEDSLKRNPESPVGSERIHLTYRDPLGADGVAFVFPGSGNQYLGMGAGYWTEFPEIARALDRENGYLRKQMVPELFAPWRFSWEQNWEREAEQAVSEDYKSLIFASVAHGAGVSDLVRLFGIAPKFVVGYSLGETAGLFAMRAWTSRDEMLRRMEESSLFVSDLAGPCDAARQFWNLPKEEKVEWVLGVIDRPADSVRRALKSMKGMERAALLIVNAPFECVVGGYRKAVEGVVEGLGCVFLPLQGVSTVHFPAAKLVEAKYRDLHLFPTTAPEGVRFYSGAWAKSYDLTRESAADSITAQAVRFFDFSAVIRQAHEDGARLFLEMGPQASCTRMISKILGPLPHAARSACQRGAEDSASLLRMLALLISERVPVDLGPLYGGKSFCVGHREPEEPRSRLRAQLGAPEFHPVSWSPAPRRHAPASRPAAAPARAPISSAPVTVTAAPAQTALAGASAAAVQAHETYLRLSTHFAESQAKNLAFHNALIAAAQGERFNSHQVPIETAPAFMDREQCMEFAVGKIGKALGEAFAGADAFPTRVRLPDEPLMLVDRILEVEGTPKSLRSGRVVTEHDVLPGAWYLDCARIPTCIAVEAGQADLFLSGYLGIDFQTKGLAMYRLLDAEVEFHGPLPTPGSVIHYDIRIDRFTQHGDIWLFFFNFEGTVAGRPFITMRKGCAGFFSQDELARGKGVVLTDEETRSVPGKLPADWKPLAVFDSRESYSDSQIDALRKGDLAACFGPAFAQFKNPVTLPSGRMRLLDRVLDADPKGGRYGLGLIRAEMDIHPDDWHLVCHFSDDNVMPGTLMYECCLHTLRVMLLRMGWVGEEGQVWYEPKPGVKSQLRCRGQVLPATKKVVYEISVKELGYGPEPFAIADAMMYSDGKPIVLISDMSVRLGGLTQKALENKWESSSGGFVAKQRQNLSTEIRKPLFGPEKIRAFAVGNPSEAFGERYKVFDSERVIARLPGPPYQFLDRITSIKDCQPWVLHAGAEIVAEYDVPKDEWYFKSNAQPTMPFAILLEVALQPCGWLAAYLGSALTSDTDLSFRNLGGTATQYIDVTPDIGTLFTKVKMTKVSQSGGLIIQNYSYEMTDSRGRLVYKGVTEFGFFTKASLSQQVGIRGAKPFETQGAGETFDPAKLSGMPDPMLLMLDKVEQWGDFLKGYRKVDPKEWFFKAHFYQDPVCPGSLGLESFVQLMKVYAVKRWGPGRFESMALGEKHEWLYRGQYTPVNKAVEIDCRITGVDDDKKLLRAEGCLRRDGLTIYQMKDFTLKLS